jgi:hypothetical protein
MASVLIQTRRRPEHASPYDEIEYGRPTETWPNVEVRSVIRISACELCQTDGNSSPVGGSVWNTGNVR